MEKLIKEDIKTKGLAVATYIESEITDRLPTESEIEHYQKIYCDLLYPSMQHEVYEGIRNMLENRFEFKLDIGNMIYDSESEPWFKEFKNQNECIYFDRYKEYLSKVMGFNKKAVDTLDNDVLDEIMDYLGDPSINFSPRKGLVLGDVQMGKTSTFIGLICKAADAGYKAIVVLTGTVESLRQQTQKRLDEGFVGFDSDHMSKYSDDNMWIGVGKYNKKRGVVLTSKNTDFVAKTASNLGFSLDSFDDTVLFVVKKNVSVLNRLIKWLSDLNPHEIGYPLLVIDDEADNASVNTKKDPDENPTMINGLIRKLLSKFTKNNYVGFTATPFANVFINPYMDDLFPKDFIYSLNAPSGYIGAKDLFLEESKYKGSIISNDDCEEVLPIKHNKNYEFSDISSSLEDALIAYMITNVIRDIRNIGNIHRGMMINISRYTSTQDEIKETIENYVNLIVRKLRLYTGNHCLSEKNPLIDKFKKVFDSYYPNLECSWESIWPLLYDSNKNIECISVNKNSKMISYDEYENGARLIIVGGMSLARGLTIEGLCISYLYRNSQMYDVLLQMGRWFGYRNGYDDLFRIWMPYKLREWYTEITESTEELKTDLEKMKDLRLRPIDVGIRIRNDKTTLKITARNKMYSASEIEVTKSMFGDWNDTGLISNNLEVNKANESVVEKLIRKFQIGEYSLALNVYGNIVWKSIPREYIIEFLADFNVEKGNTSFNKESYINFITNFQGNELDLFDVAIVEGSRNSAPNMEIAGINFTKPAKYFNLSQNEKVLRINGTREFLVNPTDTANGLTNKEKLNAEIKHKEFTLRKNPSKDPSKIHTSAGSYLKIERNPLLLIYFVDLKIREEDDNAQKCKAIKSKFDTAGVSAVGIALAIPSNNRYYTETYTYKINLIEQASYHNETEQMEEDYE